jgi:hypothetical protein
MPSPDPREWQKTTSWFKNEPPRKPEGEGWELIASYTENGKNIGVWARNPR